ncbi:MAG: hypothetical protein PWQ09_1689 [Candidatus Cloacimonadota bacterium]|nr:hypothetical protein [Candidatus Cloacimonadota bacterium]
MLENIKNTRLKINNWNKTLSIYKNGGDAWFYHYYVTIKIYNDYIL